MLGRPGIALLSAVAALAWALVMVARWIFERWAWAWPGVRLLARRPDLRGTWKGVIHSSWQGPPRGVARAPIPAFLVVKQTFSSLHLRLLTCESQSITIASAIVRQPDGIFTINGIYRNEPRISVRDRSPIHLGGLALQLGGPPPAFMTGHYWTDRRSYGEVDFWLMVRANASDFQSAETMASAAVGIGAIEGAVRRLDTGAAGGEVRKPAAERGPQNRMSPPAAEGRARLLDYLSETLPAQFDVLVVKLRVPQQYLSSTTQPQATRATEVLRYLDQHGRIDEALELMEEDLKQP